MNEPVFPPVPTSTPDPGYTTFLIDYKDVVATNGGYQVRIKRDRLQSGVSSVISQSIVDFAPEDNAEVLRHIEEFNARKNRAILLTGFSFEDVSEHATL